jgi:RNA polymerase sigma-70 factor, ECF subfamily
MEARSHIPSRVTGFQEGLIFGEGGFAMDTSGAITQMIHRLRSDDPRERDEAARQVWEHYFRDLLALAHRNLARRVRQRVDAEDVLQSMYASVCRRQRRGDFELYDRDDFWKLLVTVTLNKTRNAAKLHMRARRSVNREVALPSIDGEPDVGPSPRLEGAGCAPDDALGLVEELERRIRSLDDPLLEQVALKKLEGLTNKEIGAELDYTERTIERKLKIIREKWGALDPEPD